jgi:outer membrane protein OmpA-like peptidoglycan-associated protein
LKTSASFTGFLLCLILGAACLATLNLKLLPELRKAEEGTAGMVYLGALVQAPAEEKGEQAPEVSPLEVPAGSEDAQAFAAPEAEAAADGNPVFPDVSEAHAASNPVESSVGSDRADEGGDGVDGEARTLELVLRFEAHGYELSRAHRQALTEALQSRKGRSPFRVEVDGHSDATGAAVIDNTLLSRLRAAAVADFLTAHGVPSEKITTGAHGSTRPVDRSSNPAAWQKNRRAEVRFLEDRS